MGSSHGSGDVKFPSLAATIQKRLKETPQYSQKRCIFRVPHELRQINERAYTPALVSIGPLHDNDKRLFPMEVHKLKSLQFFLGDNQSRAVDLLNSLLGIIKARETDIRKCYADPIYLSSDDFTQMVLIDSAFIIHFFAMTQGNDNYMYNQPFLKSDVLHDIRLEENQLPFFILDDLYRACFQTNANSFDGIPSFTRIVCDRMGFSLDISAKIDQMEYYHLLHLFACHRLHKDADVLRVDISLPPATQLHEARVKFQVLEDSSSLVDISFDEKKGILKMPKFVVHDSTEYICRNLIAFEQCNYGTGKTRNITDYYYFLNCLINTPEDVQLLIEAGIIQNLMGSPKQVSDLINSLDAHACVSFNGYYYGRISLQVQRHCKKRWNRYQATLMHSYFNHPWAIISVFYAFVLLVLTVAQVVAGFI